MGQQEKQIARLLRAIIAPTELSSAYPVMSGTVLPGSVDRSAQVCAVALSSMDDDGTGVGGVMLNGVTMNANGLVQYPADGSVVWVAAIDGPGKWGIVRCSELVQLQAKIGNATLNMTSSGFSLEAGGKNLASVLGNLLSHIQALTVSTATGPSGIPINLSDFIADASDLNQILF